MARLLGVEIPNNKKVRIALTYIYGIGKESAKAIIEKLELNGEIKAKELTEEELARIAVELENNYVIEGQLNRHVRQNVQRLKDIACYRGIRHRRGLPVHGQRTRSNARTRKGPRRTVAGKKRLGKH